MPLDSGISFMGTLLAYLPRNMKKEEETRVRILALRELLSSALATLPGVPLVLGFRATDDEEEDCSQISQSLPWLQLSKYERGHGLPRLESLEKILTALGVTIFDLFTTMALLDLREEEIRSGTKRDSLMLSLLTSRGILGGSVSLALRKVVDDLVLLHGEIIAAALLGGAGRRTED